MRKPSSTPHLLWSWPLVPKRLGTSELRYFYWALLFSNSHHSLTHSPRFPLESNSDFIKICSIADGHQLKISVWSGTPFEVHLHHKSTWGMWELDFFLSFFFFFFFFLKKRVMCSCVCVVFFSPQRKHFKCSLGKNIYFTHTVIVLPKMKYVIFLK